MTSKDDELLEKQASIELKVDPEPVATPPEARPITRRIVSSKPDEQKIQLLELIDLPYAGFGRRLIACLIDAAVLACVGAVVSVIAMFGLASIAHWDDRANLYNGFWLLQVFYGVTIYAASTIFPIIFPFLSLSRFPIVTADTNTEAIQNMIFAILRGYLPMLVVVLYFAVQESMYGATIGKRIMGIKVTDLHGHKITFAKALQRNLLKGVSTATVCLGYLLCLFTKRRQAFHDLVSNCVVILSKDKHPS